jgi:uncharacterized protein (UPF0548 family)
MPDVAHAVAPAGWIRSVHHKPSGRGRAGDFHRATRAIFSWSLTQKWVANANVGKSDYERTSAGTRGSDEDAPIPGVPMSEITPLESTLPGHST